MRNRLIFLIIATLFLSSCEKEELSEDELAQRNVKIFGNNEKKESLESVERDYYHQLYFDNLAQNIFFNLFFEQRVNVDFSLDEEIMIYAFRGFCTVLLAGDNNCELFLYTRNRSKNKVWSNRCGVMEFLTQEQSKKLQAIEKELMLELDNQKEIRNPNFTLFHWGGKNRFEGGKNVGKRFEYFSRGDDWLNADLLMYDFFKNEIFTHGCKKHPL
ncbi:hypothetical protein SAMN05720766_1245 [Fibrobacter sp. UWH9]|uniref:hypothetical protein n=1 Tax=Fibrobacter sp. UWH9 TaxID=1896213 RepID=UPI00091616A3|nr:hypothetical protein [Fibrobacter sp. UWH9]SHH77554.1 hypothetical protein SAMN05720766_1245 [Fibrobacter sp. UWH9]